MIHCQVPGCNRDAVKPAAAPLICQFHTGTYQADKKFSPLLMWATFWFMASVVEKDKAVVVWTPPELDESMNEVGIPLFLGEFKKYARAEAELKWLTQTFMKAPPKSRQFTYLTYLVRASELPGAIALIGVDGYHRKSFRYQAMLSWTEYNIRRFEPIYEGRKEVVVIKGDWRPRAAALLPE